MVNGRFTTNIPGILAAGDAWHGQSLVVWVMNVGRGALNSYLAQLKAFLCFKAVRHPVQFAGAEAGQHSEQNATLVCCE